MPKNKWSNKIEQLELNGQFEHHVTPVSTKFKELDPETFEYLPKNIFYKLGEFFIRTLLIFVVPLVTFFGIGLKVKGRKKLKALKGNGAIVVSNHVLALEALAARQIRYTSNTYYISLQENYFKGPFGTAMQMGGILPLNENITLTKKLEQSIKTITNNKGLVVVYAEQALWPGYEKIRPLKRGAFLFASKFDVPIVPVVNLFRQPNWFEKLVGRKYNVTMQICDPIFPSKDLKPRQNIANLSYSVHSAMVECANAFYGTDCDATHYTKEYIDANTNQNS